MEPALLFLHLQVQPRRLGCEVTRDAADIVKMPVVSENFDALAGQLLCALARRSWRVAWHEIAAWAKSSTEGIRHGLRSEVDGETMGRDSARLCLGENDRWLAGVGSRSAVAGCGRCTSCSCSSRPVETRRVVFDGERDGRPGVVGRVGRLGLAALMWTFLSWSVVVTRH